MNPQEAVIVSTARTPIGKAYRGAFNDTEAPVLGGLVIRAALAKAGVAGMARAFPASNRFVPG